MPYLCFYFCSPLNSEAEAEDHFLSFLFLLFSHQISLSFARPFSLSLLVFAGKVQ